ncbi:hypothetical protein HOY80DRAFT_1062659 [Tuber brumale]|nr:hypothetical protein HOY80DRAFT_1062659 [Tuber brumale]
MLIPKMKQILNPIRFRQWLSVSTPINKSINQCQRLYSRKHNNYSYFKQHYNSAGVELGSVPKHQSTSQNMTSINNSLEQALENNGAQDSSKVCNDQDQNVQKYGVESTMSNMHSTWSKRIDEWSKIEKQQNMEWEKMMEEWDQNDEELDRVWNMMMEQWNRKDEERYRKWAKKDKEKEKQREVEVEKWNQEVGKMFGEFNHELVDRKRGWKERVEERERKWNNMNREYERRWYNVRSEWESNINPE